MSKQVNMLVDSIIEDIGALYPSIGDDISFRIRLQDRLEQFEQEAIVSVKLECIEAVKRVNV